MRSGVDLERDDLAERIRRFPRWLKGRAVEEGKRLLLEHPETPPSTIPIVLLDFAERTGSQFGPVPG